MDNNTQKTPDNGSGEANAKIIRICSVMIAVAIVLACFSYTKVDPGVAQIALYVLAGIIAIIGGFVIFVVAYGTHIEKQKRNFFLYDKKSGTDIDPSELRFEDIRRRLLDFMSIFKRRGKLYVGDLFDENPFIPEHFKPLFCYEILYELAVDDGRMDASAFLSFGRECADVFAKYLNQCEDYETATALKGFIFDHSKENDNTGAFREYMKTKKEHIESMMLGYVTKNITSFN